MVMILTPEELELLTGKTERAQKRYGSQQAELEHLGIPYTKRSDRTLIVFRRYVDNGQTEKERQTPPTVCL
jgi:hypothetical protein